MHEFGIAENTLSVALEQAGREGATRILVLHLRIGPLSGIVEDSLTFAFEALAAGTIAEGGQLSIEHVPVSCYCPRCRREFETGSWSYRCPDCGIDSADVRRGRELELVSLEVD